MTAPATVSPLASAFAQIKGQNGVPSWLQAARTQAFERFNEQSWPSAKHEDWRQFDLTAVQRMPWRLPVLPQDLPTPKLAAVRALVARHALPGNGPVVVLLDGRWQPQWSRLAPLPPRVRLVEWADYLAQGGAARLTLDDSQKHPFALLNQSLGSDGVVLELAAGAELSEPVQILHLASGAVDDLAYFPRTVIHLEERARAVVVETFASLGEATYLRAPVLLASLRTGAKLDLYQRQDEGAGGYHFQYSQVQVGREAQLLMAHVATGGRQGRQDLAVNQTGPGAHTDLLGVYLGSGRQVLDNHTSLNHRAPQCTSRQVYKGILDDHALGIFNGRIFVQREAQRTDAQQSNRALLLSGDARINTKPQLEIFADDVRCTHGATVGQLDPDQQFYLRARGIGEHEARAMLTMAFVGEALMSIRLAAWRAAMEQELGQRFGVLDT